MQQLAVWVLASVKGWPEVRLEASHINGDHCDNRVENLCWESHADNGARTVAHGTSIAGERHHAAVLTEVEVYAVRDLCATGELTHREIGERFGIRKATVSNIHTRKTWKHLPEKEPSK